MLHFTGHLDKVQKGIDILTETGLFNFECEVHIDVMSLSSFDDGLLAAAGQQNGFTVGEKDGKMTILYAKPHDFFRALSFVLQKVRDEDYIPGGVPMGHSATWVAQTSAFENNGYMLDCSRNAVASVPAVKRLLQAMALMGLNTLQLYTEDTFHIPGWDYFGYQRGRYTAEELKELDAYADAFGIELIPCVQTLAHLNAALRWVEFHDITDCNDILLIGEEKTYRFIEDMMAQLAKCYTSRTINIGMDEAHMLGLGKYLDKHGYQNRAEIMVKHLHKVVDICKKHGFKPMMWSDMFFRLAGGDYYSGDGGEFPKEFLEMLPEDITLVYWDYYHLGKDHYLNMLEQHKKLPAPIAFAGGAWKWGGLLPDLRFNMHTSRAALTACREAGINTVFATGWGDNGAECPAFSILPALQLQAELGYNADIAGPCPEGVPNAKWLEAQSIANDPVFTDKAIVDTLAARFKACTGGAWEDFFLLDDGNNTTPTRDGTTNTSKPLLYQDILLGLFDVHINRETFPKYYADTAKKLTAAAERNGEWAYLFNHAAAISHVLEKKCSLGIDITAAYRAGKKAKVKRIAKSAIPKTIARIDALIASFETFWHKESKPQGLEVIHIRVGGLKTRLEATQRRLLAWTSGKITSIPELDETRLPFNGPQPEGTDINTHSNIWERIASPSMMNG